jgi:hypothetical protein
MDVGCAGTQAQILALLKRKGIAESHRNSGELREHRVHESGRGNSSAPSAPLGFSNYKRIRKMLVGAVGVENNDGRNLKEALSHWELLAENQRNSYCSPRFIRQPIPPRNVRPLR